MKVLVLFLAVALFAVAADFEAGSKLPKGQIYKTGSEIPVALCAVGMEDRGVSAVAAV